MSAPLDPRLQPQDQAAQAVRHSLSVYRRIAVAFLVLTLVVVGLVLYVVFARAHVVVLSKQEDIESDFLIDIARDPGPGEVHGDVIQATETMTQTFPTTAGSTVQDHSKGTVRITSTLSRSQVLVATTRLQTPEGVLYRLSDTVTIPANGSVQAAAYADVVGKAGDTDHATFIIPGLNPSSQAFFKVETVTPFAGGERQVQAVTQENVDKAVAALKEKLTPKLQADLATMVKDHGLVVEGATSAVTIEVLTQTASAKVGTEAKEFTMTVDARATGTYFDQAQFMKQVESRLKDLIGFDQVLLSSTEDPTSRSIEKKDVASGRANVHVKAHGIAILSKDAPALDPEKLTGISTDAAEAYVKGIDGVASVSVSTSPFWSNRMPTVADHITVEVR